MPCETRPSCPLIWAQTPPPGLGVGDRGSQTCTRVPGRATTPGWPGRRGRPRWPARWTAPARCPRRPSRSARRPPPRRAVPAAVEAVEARGHLQRHAWPASATSSTTLPRTGASRTATGVWAGCARARWPAGSPAPAGSAPVDHRDEIGRGLRLAAGPARPPARRRPRPAPRPSGRPRPGRATSAVQPGQFSSSATSVPMRCASCSIRRIASGSCSGPSAPGTARHTRGWWPRGAQFARRPPRTGGPSVRTAAGRRTPAGSVQHGVDGPAQFHLGAFVGVGHAGGEVPWVVIRCAVRPSGRAAPARPMSHRPPITSSRISTPPVISSATTTPPTRLFTAVTGRATTGPRLRRAAVTTRLARSAPPRATGAVGQGQVMARRPEALDLLGLAHLPERLHGSSPRWPGCRAVCPVRREIAAARYRWCCRSARLRAAAATRSALNCPVSRSGSTRVGRRP
jgi:hypothetical protein